MINLKSINNGDKI